MSEKILYIVRGVPGSGKSTYAAEGVAYWSRAGFSSAHFEADMWMNKDGEYRFDGTRLAECHKYCQQAVCMAMSGGIERIYVANTFVKKWEADVYMTLAKLWGYRVEVCRMTGSFDNVHGVPRDRIDIMTSNMEVYPDELYITPFPEEVFDG